MAKREARKHTRPSETDDTSDAPPEIPDDAGETSDERAIDTRPPNAPPIRFILSVAALGLLVMAAFFWLRAPGGSSVGPTLFDKDRDAHAALVGAWRCAKDTDGFSYLETLVLLEGGRYTRQRHVNKAGESWMNLEEQSGSWEVVGERILYTVDSCEKYDMKETKPCLPTNTLMHNLKLPIMDSVEIGDSCGPLKRIGERKGS